VININDILNFLHNPHNIVVFHFGCWYHKETERCEITCLPPSTLCSIWDPLLYVCWVCFSTLLRCSKKFFFPWYSALHFSTKTDNPIYLTILFPWFHYGNLEWFIRRTIKDGAYYCYCAYVLRISRYSYFLSPMLTNTGIFLRGLKLSGESRS